jgi:hypothetical protein
MLDSILLKAPVYLLVFVRCFALIMTLPMFSMRAASRIAKVAIAGYMAFFIFGSLDTSNLKVSVKRKMNDFCTAFGSENHAGAEGYFSRKYIFNYVFFLQAFEDGWKNCFQNDKSKNPAFTKWMFGEPFNGSDIIQIPVRFYADCGTIDMMVFLNSKGNNEIYQITIDRWQKV